VESAVVSSILAGEDAQQGRLPQPLGPTSAAFSPALRLKVMLESTVLIP
jgi:hypothetical protein